MDTGRYRSLDGLRGIAAVVVLVHHSLLVIPALALPYFGGPTPAGTLGLLVDSPLHLAWAGTEAVYLFFVLSGLVLGLAAHSPRFSWGAYFPSRIVRLYVPVIAAVLLGAAIIAVTPVGAATESPWLLDRPPAYNLGAMLTDMTLLGGISHLISPLWSLQWEVLFSLLLPVFLLSLRRRWWMWQLPVLVALATLGAYAQVGAVKYLPIFGIGVVLAKVWEPLAAWLSGWSRRGSLFIWVPALIAALVLVCSYWLLRRFMGDEIASYATLPLILAGVVVLVVGAAFGPGIRALLSSQVFNFLGTISFSLYLVHEPVVIFISRTLPNPTYTVLLALPVSIALAVVFWLAVERPAHRFSRAIRARVDASKLSLAA